MGVRLPSPIVRRGVRLRAHQQGSGGVIECKGLEIRPIGGGYMLTNQRRVYVDQSERRSSKFNQSEPSSQNAMRGTLLRV